MGQREEHESKMLEIVLMSHTMGATEAAKKYGINRSTLIRWRKKYSDEGSLSEQAVDPLEILDTDEYITPQVLPGDTSKTVDIFASKALNVRMKALKKMSELMEKSTDLEEVTKAFKVIDDSIQRQAESFPIAALQGKTGSIFDAARLIAENKKEIQSKQKELLANEKPKDNTD